MIVSRTRRRGWQRMLAGLTMSMLFLVFTLCLPVTALAAEEPGGESSDDSLSIGTGDVDISTPLTPPEGSAEIVEVVKTG